MAWRDKLQRGEFRGVPFLCETARQEVGRRIVVHSYPLRPAPYPEDLGRRHRTYSLTLFVIGQDYMAQRDQLILALEEEGPGTLIHPYRGRIRVVVTDGEVSESKDEGGMARFTVSFIESGELEAFQAFPIEVVDTADQTELAADAAEEAITEDFAEEFAIDGETEFIAESALDKVNGALDQLDDLRKQLTPDLSVLTDAVAFVAKVRSTVLSLALLPKTLAQAVLDAIHGVTLVADSVSDVSFRPDTSRLVRSRIFSDAAVQAAASPVIALTDGTTRRRQKQNQAALNRFMQRAYLTQLARLAVRTEFESRDDALAERNLTTQLIRAEMEQADTSADTYQSFSRLQAALARHLDESSAKLARIGHLRLQETEPALVTAYAIYGDVHRVDELVDRNHVEHPAFMPASQPLEVLLG